MVNIPLSGNLYIELSEENIRRFVTELKRAETIVFYQSVLFLVTIPSLEFVRSRENMLKSRSFEENFSSFYFYHFDRGRSSIDYSKLEYPLLLGAYCILDKSKTLLEIIKDPAHILSDSISSFDSRIGNCLVLEWESRELPELYLDSLNDINSVTIGIYKKDQTGVYKLEKILE